MANSTATKSAFSKKSTVPCPNSSNSAHNQIVASGHLTKKQVRSAVSGIDIGKFSDLQRAAKRYAIPVGIEGEDLLQDAIVGALTTRKVPRAISIKSSLKGIMKSKASVIAKRRKRGTDVLRAAISIDAVGEIRDTPTPEEIVDQKKRDTIFREALKEISKGPPEIQAVLDGIDKGLIGKKLCASANIGIGELATVRTLIRRRAKKAMERLSIGIN